MYICVHINIDALKAAMATVLPTLLECEVEHICICVCIHIYFYLCIYIYIYVCIYIYA